MNELSGDYETQLSKSLHETNTLIEKLSKLNTSMMETKNDIKALDTLVKSVTQDCLQLIKVWNKSNGLKKVKKLQSNQTNIPKTENVDVSDKMSSFLLALDLESPYNRVDITRTIQDYIKKHNLIHDDDIIFDETLSTLFNEEKCTFFNLHTLISKHITTSK